MSDTQAVILKEAADLHRFLQPIVKMCAVARSDYPYYKDASYVLFDHLGGLISRTLEYLESVPTRPVKSPVIQRSLRQKLKLIRDSWGLLHRYIKPSLDADTLHVPLALLNVLDDLLNEVPGCEHFKCAVFQLAEVNYAMLTYNEVNSVANGIARQVNGKLFPQTLSLVGIPYSQSSGLFLNCLIPHEMAHFVFQEIANEEVAKAIDDILDRHYPDAQGASDEFLQTLSQIRGLMNIWIEEIFCDLFAISLVGPAFTFAFAEITSAALLLEKGINAAKQPFEFGQSHPADVARFYLHLRHLQALGWWQHISSWKCDSIALLEHCGRVFVDTIPSNKLSPDVRAHLKLQCFWDSCDWLLQFVKSRVPFSGRELTHLAAQYDVIAEYLANAIVPSTIVMKSGPTHPLPAVLVNSAFRFVHEDISKLLDNVEKKAPVRDRSWYTERLELWVLKALEDVRMLRPRKEVKNGGSL